MLLAAQDPQNPAGVAVDVRILDRQTKVQKVNTGLLKLDLPKGTGNLVIPQALRVPASDLAPGSYMLVVDAIDNTGKQFERTADFEIQ